MKGWKADEMETAINSRAARLAYWTLTGSLLVWCAAELLQTRKLPAWPFGIACAGVLVFLGAKLILTRRMTGGQDDEE